MTLAELLSAHPGIARRTAQRLIAALIARDQVTAQGEGRARRYFLTGRVPGHRTQHSPTGPGDRFPPFIPLSADSHDILAYINQPSQARKPVGYQADFLGA